MKSTIHSLVAAGVILLPLGTFAQSAMPPVAMPLDLGTIPDGEERTVTLTGRIDLENASQAQSMAAVQRVMFSVSRASGFCISLTAPGDAVQLSLVGRESSGAPALFDLNTVPFGIASGDGKRNIVRTVAPIVPTTFLLAAVVGQTSTAPGDTLDLIVRAYPDSTAIPQLDALCGPALNDVRS